jgi:hypothetical protein
VQRVERPERRREWLQGARQHGWGGLRERETTKEEANVISVTRAKSAAVDSVPYSYSSGRLWPIVLSGQKDTSGQRSSTSSWARTTELST